MVRKSFDEVWKDTDNLTVQKDSWKRNVGSLNASPQYFSNKPKEKDVASYVPNYGLAKPQPTFQVNKEPEKKRVTDIGSWVDSGLRSLTSGGLSTIGGAFKGVGNFIDNPMQTVSAGLSLLDPVLPQSSPLKTVSNITNLTKSTGYNSFVDNNDIGNTVGEWIDSAGDWLNQKSEEIDIYDREAMDGATRLVNDVARGVGGMIPAVLGGAVTTPAVGLAIIGTSSFGNSMDEALKDGATYEDALKYGIANAAVELGTEKLFGGIPGLGEGWLDKFLGSSVKKLVGNEGGRQVFRYIADSMFGEAVEEGTSGLIGEFLPDIYKRDGQDYTVREVMTRLFNAAPEAGYQALVGALSGGVLGSANAVSNIKNGRMVDRFNKTNGTNYTLDEVMKDPTLLMQAQVVDTAAEAANEQIKDNPLFNNPNNDEIHLDELVEGILMAQETENLNRELLAEEQVLEAMEQQMTDPQLQANDVQPQAMENVAEQSAMSNEVYVEPTPQEQVIEGLKSTESAIQMQAQNVNTQTIQQTASLHQVTNEVARKVSEVANGLGVKVEFVDSLENGAEGAYQNGTLYISKNTSNPVQEVFKHELTHHLESTGSYQQFQQTMFQLANKLGYDVNDLSAKVRQRYAQRGIELSDAELNAEVTAILAQDKIFTDKNTVNDLCRIDASTGYKIWQWIREKIYSFRKGTQTRSMLLKAERLYRNALSEAKKQNNISKNTKYLISNNNAKSNASPNDLDYQKYTYAELIKHPDLPLINIKNSNYTNLSIPDLLKVAKKNALASGAKSADGKSFIVTTENGDVYVNQKSLIHVKDDNGIIPVSRFGAIANVGELLKNSIKLNEVYRKGKSSSVYFNEYIQAGDRYIVRFIVKDGTLNKAASSKLHAISAQKKGRTYAKSKSNSRLTPLGTSRATSVAHVITIAELLEDVNSIKAYKNSLPLDVYYKLNKKYDPKKENLTGAKYSLGLNADITEENHKYLQDLKTDIEILEKDIQELEELREKEVIDSYKEYLEEEELTEDDYPFSEFESEFSYGDYDSGQIELDELNEKLSEAESKYEQNKKQLSKINKLIQELKPDDVSVSRKSISTYLKFPKSRYESLLKYFDDNGIKVDNEYYQDLIDDGDFDDEVSDIEVRISDHNVGSYFDFDYGQSIPYNDRNIKINLKDIPATNDTLDKKKYSLGMSSNRKKDLMAVHNISADKLRKSFELGGLPMPSIAVTKDSIGHGEFGDISLVFNKETIDPEMSHRNKVYSRDAWTPTFPQVEYQINSDEAFKLRDELKKSAETLAPVFKNDVNRALNNYIYDDETSDSVDTIVDKLKDKIGLQALYLEENGIHVEPVYVEVKEPEITQAMKDLYERIMSDYGQDIISDFNTLDAAEFKEKYGYEKVKEALITFIQETRKMTHDKAKNYVEHLGVGRLRMTIFYAIDYSLKENNANNDVKMEYSSSETLNKINSFLDKQGYEKWLRNKVSRIVGKAGIRNGKELYTRSGNRRTFNQLHDSYDLENVVDYMRNQDQTGNTGFGSGFNTVLAARSKSFNNIQEIIDSENNLHSNDESYAEELNSLKERYNEFEQEALNSYKYDLSYNLFGAFEELASAGVDAAKKGLSISSVKSSFNKHDFRITDSMAKKFIDIIEDADKLTTDYFEAKPQRAVRFDEVNTAVVPNTLSEEMKEQLRNNGINFVEYDPTVEGDRQRVLSSLEDVKFSMGLSTENLANPATKENLKEKVVAYDNVKKRLRNDLISSVDMKYIGKQMNDLIDEATVEILNEGNISSRTRSKLFSEFYNNTVQVDLMNGKENAEILNDLKGDTVYISKYDAANIPDFNSYRRENQKYLKFTTNENKARLSVDQKYQEMSELYPGLFDDSILASSDKLQKMIEVAEQLQPNTTRLSESGEYSSDEAKKWLRDEFERELNNYSVEVQYRSEKSKYDKSARKIHSSFAGEEDIPTPIKLQDKFHEVLNGTEALSEIINAEENPDLNSTEHDKLVRKALLKFNGRKGALSNTYSQNFDNMANGDLETREALHDLFEAPLREAKRDYVKNLRDNLGMIETKIIKELGIKPGTIESAAVQWYDEGKRPKQDFNVWLNKKAKKLSPNAKIELEDYGLYHLKQDFPKTYKNIMIADSLIRNAYDDYVERMNTMLESVYSEKTLRNQTIQQKNELMAQINVQKEMLKKYQNMASNGYMTPEVRAMIDAANAKVKELSKAYSKVEDNVYAHKRLKKRNDYYHHFYEMTKGEQFKELMSQEATNNISNKLAGLSEWTKPKAKWSSIFERQHLGRYTQDAISGFLDYAKMAEYKIAFDPVIASNRNTIQKMAKISDEYNADNTRALTWLSNWTNDLAGKTNPVDRILSNTEKGRDWIRILNLVNSRIKGNAVALNLNSALSQFLNAPNVAALLSSQGGAKWGTDATLGTKDYISYVIGKMTGRDLTTSPLEKSVFMQERYMDDIYDAFRKNNKLREKLFNKLSDFSSFLLTFGDQVVAEQAWFSAYRQGQRLKVADPIEYADKLVMEAVAGRGVGEVPLWQKSQLVKLVAPFQVEVNNQFNLIKKMIKNPKEWGSLMVMALVAWMLGKGYEEIGSSTDAFNPIGAISEGLKLAEQETNNFDKAKALIGRFGGEILSNVPMGANITQMIVQNDYDREKIFGDTDPSRYGTGNMGINAISDRLIELWNGDNFDWQALVGNFVTPFGGKQLERTYKAAEDLGIIPRVDISLSNGLTVTPAQAGSYDKNLKKLRFVPGKDETDALKSLVFGVYSSDAGKEYSDEQLSPFSEKNTKLFQEIVLQGNHSAYDTYQAMREAKSTGNSYEAAFSLRDNGILKDAIEAMSEYNKANPDAPLSPSALGTSTTALDIAVALPANSKINADMLEEASNIEGIKEDGETVANSKAAQVRKYYEDKGVYNEIVRLINSGQVEPKDFGLNKTVIEMDGASFQRFINELK